MNSSFEKNCIRPGDPGYEYDKQVNFGNSEKEDAGWDSPEDDFWSWSKGWLVAWNYGKNIFTFLQFDIPIGMCSLAYNQ